MITLNTQTYLLTSSQLNDVHIAAGFSTKPLGDAREKQNIINFLSKNNLQYSCLVKPKQCHSIDIKVISHEDCGEYFLNVDSYDGLVTKEKGIVLTVMTADCVPIIFADHVNGVIGVSHQGWKGTLGRMAQKMVTQMLEIGAQREHIIAAIGPSIGSCCYEVYGERKELFEKEFKEYGVEIMENREGKFFLNIALLNYLQLKESGILETNIEVTSLCTRDNPTLFWSYQRDTKETFGEMFHFIVRT